MERKERRKSRVNYKELNANKKFCNEEVIIEVAEDLHVSQDIVRRVADSQSKFTAQIVKSGALETIMYVHLGKFKVNPYQIQKMMANAMKIWVT